jgi:hypothetical protein
MNFFIDSYLLTKEFFELDASLFCFGLRGILTLPRVRFGSKMIAKICSILLIDRVGSRFTALIGYSGIKVDTHTTDVQLSMAGRAIVAPTERQAPYR